jgi:hypothetical protein
VKDPSLGPVNEQYNKQELFDEGMLTPSDMHSDMVDQDWLIMMFAVDPGGPYHYTYEQYIVNYKAQNPGKNLEVTAGISLLSPNRPDGYSEGHDASLFCYYEHALDDDNFTAGDGKFMSHDGNKLTPWPQQSNFDNCDTMPKQKVKWIFRLL